MTVKTAELLVNDQPVYAGYFSGSYLYFWTNEQEAKEWAKTAYSSELQLNGVYETFQPGELVKRQGYILLNNNDFVANEEDFVECKWKAEMIEI